MNELCMKVKQLKDVPAIIVDTLADPNVDENIAMMHSKME